MKAESQPLEHQGINPGLFFFNLNVLFYFFSTVFFFLNLKCPFLFKNMLIRLHWVLTATRVIFVTSCGIFRRSTRILWLWRVDSGAHSLSGCSAWA